MTIRDFIPPVLTHAMYRYGGRLASNSWSGDYASWADALKHSGGYDAEDILEKVKAATLKVQKGEAVFERDSVLFYQPQYNWPLLASLLWSAAQNGGELNVLDFGGSLGSVYFQNRKFTDGLSKVKWNVVEQEHLVTCGNQLFRNEELGFYATIEECVRKENPSVILFSSVLQYIEDPLSVIQSAMTEGPEFIIVDNTPMLLQEKERITVQRVNAKIYKASYPCRMFSRARFLDWFTAYYHLVAEFESDPSVRPSNETVSYEGFLFRRK